MDCAKAQTYASGALGGRHPGEDAVARWAGIRELILPERNRKDVDEDVPEPVKADMTIHFVSEIGQVLDLTLKGGPGSAAAVQDGKGEWKVPSRKRKPETVAA